MFWGLLTSKLINIFSITDHDSVKSVNDIKVLDLGDLIYIPGVEISSIYKGIKMHILGYNFKVNDNLEDMLKDIQEKRLKRFYDILGKKNSPLSEICEEVSSMEQSKIFSGCVKVMKKLK